MRQDDFERQRRMLEEQLESDLELVRAAHRTKLRALEALRSAAADAEPSLPLNQPLREARDAPVPGSSVVRNPPGQLIETLEDAWDQIPTEFDKRDLYHILGYQPARATVDRALSELLLGKKLVVQQGSNGRHLTRYRKIETD